MKEVVFFDIGSTLMHESPAIPEMFTRVAHDYGHDVALEDVLPHMAEVNAYYEREYRLHGDFWCSHESTVRIWKNMYCILADGVGLKDDAQRISEEIHARYRDGDSWALYSDSMPCLNALKQTGYRLGVISNWDADLEHVLREVGIAPYFDDIIASSVVGCRKPDPEIFRIALNRMEIDADHAVHVGDLPEADGASARVGITPLIVDRRNVYNDSDLICIDTLDEVPSLLERMDS